jgi:hypothetical protein
MVTNGWRGPSVPRREVWSDNAAGRVGAAEVTPRVLDSEVLAVAVDAILDSCNALRRFRSGRMFDL